MFSGPHNRMILNDLNTTEGSYDTNNESPPLLFTPTSATNQVVDSSSNHHHHHHIHQQPQEDTPEDDLNIQFYSFQHPVNQPQPQPQQRQPSIARPEYKKVLAPGASKKTREEHLERKRIRAKERRLLEKQQKILQKQRLDQQEKIATREKLLKAPLVEIPEDLDFDNYEITSETDIKDLLVDFRKSDGVIKTKDILNSINDTFKKLYSGKSVSVTTDTETLESTHQAGECTTITKTTITTVTHSRKPLFKFSISQFCQFWKIYYKAFMVPYHAKVTPYKRLLICALESLERATSQPESTPIGDLSHQINTPPILALPTSSSVEQEQQAQLITKKRKRSKSDNCQVKFILYFSAEDKLIFLERFNDVDHEHDLNHLLNRCKVASYKTLEEREKDKLEASVKASEKIAQISLASKKKYGPYYTKKVHKRIIDPKKLKMLPKQLENSAISQYMSVLSFNGSNNAEPQQAVSVNKVIESSGSTLNNKLAHPLDSELLPHKQFEQQSLPQSESPQPESESESKREQQPTQKSSQYSFLHQLNTKPSLSLTKSGKQLEEEKQREMYFETATKNRNKAIPKHVMVNEDGTLSDNI